MFVEKFENAIVRKMATLDSEILLDAVAGVCEVSFEDSYARMLLRRVLARKLALEEVAEDSVPEIQDLLANLESEDEAKPLKSLLAESAAALFPSGTSSEKSANTSSFGIAKLISELALEKENWDTPTETQDELRQSGIEVV